MITGQPAIASFALTGQGVHFDGWVYIPVFVDGTVDSMVVVSATPSPEGSQQIIAKWFFRSETGWSAVAWRTHDRKAALTSVKNILGLPDESDQLWPVDPAARPDGSDGAEAPEPFGTGVFEDDPLLLVVESDPDPILLLEVLVAAGWQASDAVLFESPCRMAQLLDGLATGFEAMEPEHDENDPGLTVILSTIADPTCQVVPAPPPPCPPSIVFGPIVPSCVVTTPWALTSTSVAASTGGCFPKNCWHGAFFHVERRSVTRTYATCAVCTLIQFRTKDCTASTCSFDLSGPSLGTPPCNAGMLPAGYTPPPTVAAPICGAPAGTPNCGSWSAWSPEVNEVCP